MELGDGQGAEGAELLERLVAEGATRRDALVLVGCSVAAVNPDAGYECVEVAARAAIGVEEWGSAAAAFNEFVNRVPNHIPALMRLVEICVDGGLEATMYSAQSQLADAYLAIGAGAEARVIAEDLVAREPWERANIERFRSALALLGEANVDGIIAERLSGQSPFLSIDFSWAGDAELADATPQASPSPAPPAATPDPVAHTEPDLAAQPAAKTEEAVKARTDAASNKSRALRRWIYCRGLLGGEAQPGAA